jgi:hypothetical protein
VKQSTQRKIFISFDKRRPGEQQQTFWIKGSCEIGASDVLRTVGSGLLQAGVKV